MLKKMVRNSYYYYNLLIAAEVKDVTLGSEKLSW